MMPTLRAPCALLAIVAAGLLAADLGCSFSYSSGSLSDSSKNSSDSIKNSSDSSSSSSKDSKSSFADDVVEYTRAYVAAGGGAESFLGGVGDLARKRGISDWEAQDASWVSIGRGLGMTEASDAQLAAYQRAWTGGDARRMAAIQQGVDRVR